VSYRYPGASGDIDYDYVEYGLTANFDDRLWFEYAYSPDLFSSGDATHNADIYAEWPVTGQWALGVGGGYYDVSNFVGSGYWYWTLGMTRFFEYADLDLRFHDTSAWVPVVSAADRAGARFALTVRIPF